MMTLECAHISITNYSENDDDLPDVARCLHPFARHITPFDEERSRALHGTLPTVAGDTTEAPVIVRNLRRG